MLFVVVALASLTRPIVADFSVRDLILLAGGMFLLYKAVHEIHHTVELGEQENGDGGKVRSAPLAPLSPRLSCWTLFFPSIR